MVSWPAEVGRSVGCAVAVKAVNASIVSTRPGRTEQKVGGLHVPLDGICCDADGEWLEMFGWPTEVARSVDRAVAVKARADWMARLGSLDGRRKAFDADGWRAR